MVYLDGSKSSDLDGDTLSYQWIQTGGAPITISNPTSVAPSFEAFYVDPEGETFTFQLTVTDSGGLQSTDTCIVNVVRVNNPPVAKAGIDQDVNMGVQVFLDGSGSSDPDGDSLFYQWAQRSGTHVTLNNPTAVQPAFDSPYGNPEAETLTFELTVTDTGGLKSTDATIVNVASVPVTEEQILSFHISDISMSTKKAGPNVNAIATVTVIDDEGNRVGNAKINGYWSGLSHDIDSRSTSEDGTVSLSSNKLKRPSGTFIFTIDNISKDGCIYNPMDNAETSDFVSIP